MNLELIEVWAGVLFTISVLSLVFKDSILFHFAEHLLVAVTAANGIVTTYSNYLKPAVSQDIARDGKYILIIPLLLGLLTYARFFPRLGHLARIPMAFMLGVGAAYTLARQPGLMLNQITASFLKLNSINNVIFAGTVVSVLVYFFFVGVGSNRAYKGISQVGKAIMLVAFGAGFANTIMTRMSVLLDRMQFLVSDWLHIGV